ncbi:hypothetical protein QRX60_47745 [Amycolatopsis mongoliensis]|uniref:Uncharacterized protein n=1 Tax=Amycolatopsis mongoliensis TaxID=715475 RepID=A0A9Y2JN93_9PSEU|nr:hypothetical protein [Amycolatopsis sp. 4-36]WIY01633.1 hypothetical protein QRX60_47745 [Amycolatopsis sp. 4-36]
MRQFTLHHDDVTIPVSRGGRGRPLDRCPGLSSTQAYLRELAELLRRDHDVVTFDLRATASRRRPAAGRGPGAALRRGAPGTVGRLVLVDGANPVPEPFLTEADLPVFRAMRDAMAAENEARRGTARQVLLTGPENLDLNVEIDEVRSHILDRYRDIDCPIGMIMSTAMAGEGGEGLAVRCNRNWRAGVERLVRARPDIATSWLDADHGLVFTHAPEIARIVSV